MLRHPNRKIAIATISNRNKIASDLKSQSASEMATKSTSKSVENKGGNRNCDRSDSKSLTIQIASGLDWKWLAIWASKQDMASAMT